MFCWVDHTSELELRLEASNELGVFAEALRALGELLAGEAVSERVALEREVLVAAPDRAALLAEWLGELVFLAETEDLVPARMGDGELRPAQANAQGSTAVRLHAHVQGYRGHPRHLVKAVTYHRLAFAPADTGASWRATCVLDV